MSRDLKKVIVGMSGGVDSSIAAALLLEHGFAVHGVMLCTWKDQDAQGVVSIQDEIAASARSVADQLGISFSVLDVQAEFREAVVKPFVQDYLDGITPSPCVGCNRRFKWNYLLDYADRDDAEWVATGHYAHVQRSDDGTYQLLRGKDWNKDQSYMLSGLNQAQLARTRFPIGNLTKPEVRAVASRLGLSVAEREESQDLCFLPDKNYWEFIQRFSKKDIESGEIIDSQGKYWARMPDCRSIRLVNGKVFV